jgi:hypothetical protein
MFVMPKALEDNSGDWVEVGHMLCGMCHGDVMRPRQSQEARCRAMGPMRIWRRFFFFWLGSSEFIMVAHAYCALLYGTGT